MKESVRDISVKGQRLRVAQREGAGRPLLLCNGIGASLGTLQPFVDALDPDIPVIRFDVPGIGGSALPPRPYSFHGLARLLESLLDELEVGEVDVLGLSWGGALAQQFAFQNPRRCRRLVLASTATGSIMVPARWAVLRNMLSPRRYRDPEFTTRVGPTLYGGRIRLEPDAAARLLEGHSTLPSRRAYALQLAAGVGWTSLPWLPLIRQPTMLVAGRDDPLIPLVNARIMVRLLPHASLLVYDDGHLGLLTSADVLGPEIARFLRPPGTAGA